MSNEVVIRTGKTLRVGDVEWIIVEPVDVPLACPDFVADARTFNGTVHLSLATTRLEGGAREAVICTRLRMDLTAAQMVHNMLGNLIADALKPAAKDKAN